MEVKNIILDAYNPTQLWLYLDKVKMELNIVII